MTTDDLKSRNLENEFVFSATRSSGAGGQNVNKVNTKVELRFQVSESQILTEDEKALLLVKLASGISNDGFIIVVSQTERSQIKNKEVATEKFYKLISKALTKRKKRKSTAPTRQSREKRLNSKKILSEKKEMRKKIE
jgi:ribosome-associated protein